MKKLKVYLDTSVVSYLYQEDAFERMQDTLALWELFRQGVYEILKEDVIYKEFHNFYSKIYNNPDLIMYIPNFERNLEVLISDGYKEGQLMFILDRNDSEWKTFDK